MRSPRRFALAVLVALAAAELATWAFVPRGAHETGFPWLDLVRLARPVIMAGVAFGLARSKARPRVLIAATLLGAVIAEEIYLAFYGACVDRGGVRWERLANVELVLLALARGVGIFLAGRGQPRWIDGALLAGPVVVVDFLLSFVSSVRALGDNFSVSVVTPHLGEVLAWGAVVAVLVPLVGGRQRA